MTNEELKKKIIEVLKDNTREAFSINGKSVSCYDIFAMQEAKINAIADALIAAGIGDVKEEKFEADHYWNMWQGALVELERAERRAILAERALKVAADLGELCAPVEDYIQQAERELAEEK